MPHNIDYNSPLTCRGVIGDGCGGGRVFFIKDEKLKAYDSTNNSYILLKNNIKNALKISKKGCIITITYREEETLFDLSKLA